MSTPKECLVIDLEATCWKDRPPNETPEKERQNEIIEIGITTVDMKTRKITDSESIIVWPTTTKISEFCTKLTTLTPEFVNANGTTFREAIRYMRDKYDTKRNMWASWGDWDMFAFKRQCEKEGVPYPFNTNHLNVKSAWCWKHGFNCGVGKACNFAGIKFEGTSHRGIDDSKMIAKLLLTL